MDTSQPLTLLGGLSPQTFMKRHWQKKPLLIRQAVPQFNTPGFKLPVDAKALFALAASDDVESRLVMGGDAASQTATKSSPKKRNKPQNVAANAWQLKSGPFARRALPLLTKPNWSLLVQGVDLHVNTIRDLMDQFRFVPDARLDDVMISYASAGGGVGPHFDSYDVFLLQAHGRRQWQISQQKDLTLQPDMPLKILANFEPEHSFVLEPGDMLYLPPRYAHDGVALDECMTYSIGFRAPNRGELARELLQRLGDDAQDEVGAALYRDAKQPAVMSPAEIPAELAAFALGAVQAALKDPVVLQRAFGEFLTELKPDVWFDLSIETGVPGGSDALEYAESLALDRRTKMMFDERHVFINGESFLAQGRDAVLMRRLANERRLASAELRRASADARGLLQDWIEAGWIHAC
jgi:50S ribosomal protein L16 3-hydroxylase